MAGLTILCIVLAAAVILLSVKLLLIRRSANEICREFAEIVSRDTNRIISLSSRDKAMQRLAVEINKELKILRKERHRFAQGDLELKSAVTNISHDLRTPLTAIYGYLDLLEGTEKSPKAAEYIKTIKGRAEVMKQLTEELFRYSVITSPENLGNPEKLSLGAVLEESIAGFYLDFRKASISPKINITSEKVVRSLNPAALSRVFSNLLSNAIKYSDGDLYISLSEKGEVTFSNMASSLSEVQVGRLFDRFYTVESVKKSTGLGLSIVKVLVEQMEGEITADYTAGRLTVKLVL